VISLAALAALASEHADDLDLPVAPLRIAGTTHDTTRRPLVMGIVNLSQDSWYRESIAHSPEAAVRRGLVLNAQGADLVDVGAETVVDGGRRLSDAEQVTQLVPVVSGLAEAGVAVSVETYSAVVAEATLEAGAALVNLTGSEHDEEVFAAAARHGAAVLLCHVLGAHARAVDTDATLDDPVQSMLDNFAARIECARQLGCDQLLVDPGAGFGLPGLTDGPHARSRYQGAVLLQSFRLRRLGVPVAQSLPSALQIFEDQSRSGEGFFAVLAHLGGAGLHRTHEVPLVRAVLESMRELSVDGVG
jgi:dihydropteroate synthase